MPGEQEAPRRVNAFGGGPLLLPEPQEDLPESESDEEVEITDIRELRRLAELGRTANLEELEARNADLQRQIAVHESGVDADSALGKVFLRGYIGDPTNAEAMRSTAVELGVPLKPWAEDS